MQEVLTIKSWINIHASPFAWQRILFKLLPEFKKEGFFFHTITDDSKLSPTLLEKISEALFDTYKLELSTDFFKTSSYETPIVSHNESEQKHQNSISQDDDRDLFKNESDNSDDLV